MSQDHKKSSTEPVNTNPGYRDDDINASLITKITIGVVVMIILVMILMVVLGNHHNTREEKAKVVPVPPQARERVLPEGNVTLQVLGAKDLEIYLTKEQEILENYSWTDLGKTHARIPIQKAMDLMVNQVTNTNHKVNSNPDKINEAEGRNHE